MMQSVSGYGKCRYCSYLVVHLAALFLFVSWPAGGYCQGVYFSMYPAWASAPTNNTKIIALGDVDGDGDLDLVCANGSEFGGQSNSLYMNVGGAFETEPSWYSAQADSTVSLALGDIDGDGDLDLVCGNCGKNMCYLNEGGIFEAEPSWLSAQANMTFSIALGDIDGNGFLDLVCGNFSKQCNTIYLNEGGTFETEPSWSSVQTHDTRIVALGDIDGNGDLDLVCGGDTVTLYLNEGGTFETEPSWSVEQGGSGVTLGDIDGDGDLDLVCGGFPTCYLNEGGIFETEPFWAGQADYADGVVLGDIDGDGDLDLVCGSYSSISSNTLYLNEGGTFETEPSWLSGQMNHTWSVALGDIDGDGDLDLVCGNNTQSNTLYLNEVSVFETAPSWSSVQANATTSVAAGDIDGDGDLDLVCGNLYNQSNTVYLNEGGTFETEPSWSSGQLNSTVSIALRDIDGDGDLDLVCGNGFQEEQSNTLYLNGGGTIETEPSWSSAQVNATYSIALGDIDGNGYLDLVCGDTGSSTLYLNGGGTFGTEPSWSSGQISYQPCVALGDINGDREQDLVCVVPRVSNSLYLNEGGTFEAEPSWSSEQLNFTASIAMGDIDGDGNLDLVCGNNSQSNTLYLNEGKAFETTPSWYSGLASRTMSVALGDIDGDGDLDLVCGNYEQSSTLYLNDGGTIETEPSWSSGQADNAKSVALGDIDRDGDLDLVCGNYGQSNTLYLSTLAPAYKGDPLDPRNHLPNNGAFIRSAEVEKIDSISCRIHFDAIDVESDPVWLVPEYHFDGEPVWYPVEIRDYADRIGPFETSPGGVRDSVDWDTHLIQFDRRDVILRLRAVSVPSRVSIIQHIASYLVNVGSIEPLRPEISASADTLFFSTISLGDTASVDLVISNSGNELLSVNDMHLPSTEMRLSKLASFTLLPGQRDTISVYLEPRSDLDISGEVQIQSNDPLTPNATIRISTDIRALSFQTRLLNPMDEVPLGEALTINVIPGPEVTLEKGYVHYRASGSGLAFMDSVAFALFAEGDFMAVIPGEGVTEAGLDYYIRMENSGVFATDPPVAPEDSVYFQAVQQPETIATAPGPNRGSDFLEGRDIKVSVTLPEGASFAQGALHYRRGGEYSYQDVEFQQGDPLPFATIPDSVPGPRGIAYWVEVQTLTRTLTDPPTTPELNPSSIQVTATDLSETASHPGEQYRLLSIPLDIKGPLMGVITDDIGGPDNTRWRMYAYEHARRDYMELPNDSIFSFEQGRGYWFITREPHRLDTSPAEGLSTPTDSAYSLLLEPGYNLIGNPFAFCVSWDSILVAAPGGSPLPMTEAEMTVVEPLVEWMAGEGYSYDADILEPFNGYWVKNLMDTSIVLLVPPREVPDDTSTSAPLYLAGAETGEERGSWRIDIRMISGDASDLENFIGVSAGASDFWDSYDRSEAPLAPGNAISLYFPHASWLKHRGSYSSDIRGSYKELDDDLLAALGSACVSDDLTEGKLWGHLWRFDIVKNFSKESAGDEVFLEFNGIESVPANAAIYLVDRGLDRLIDLRKGSSYSLCLGKKNVVSDEESARFVLLVGSEDFIDSQEDQLPEMPEAMALHQNYPNPFNPATVIRYDVARSSHVEIKIYDIRGALVRTMLSDYRDPGRYEIGWNGKNENGVECASGIYFYRLIAGDFVQTKKMVLLK